jgi:glycosyltransferase involved in cell wall biosynthesis
MGTMQPGEPLLIVSHTFPPYRGIGGRRWAKFAKALARRGHPVHVIHSDGPKELKGSLWSEDVRTPGIVTHPLPQRYPTVLFKRPLKSLGEKLAYRLWGRVMPLLVKGNWLDKAVLWEGPFLKKAEELIRTHGIRHVVITGAPFRLLHFGLKLKQRCPGIVLTGDLRDPWTWGHVYGHGTLGAEREAHERAMEAAVMQGYDHITCPAPAMLDHLRRTYGGDPTRFVLLPHAIDPDDLGTPAPPLRDGRLRIIYAGSLYGAQEAEAYFKALLKGLTNARERDPEAFHRCQLDLYITGHGVDRYTGMVKAAGLEGTIHFHAPLPARQLFPLVRQADLVLIFIPSGNRDLLGTKFNEIFFLRKPVLHVGVPGLVSHTITAKRLGASITVEDLPSELPRIIAGEHRISVEASADLGEIELDRITDRLLREVLV